MYLIIMDGRKMVLGVLLFCNGHFNNFSYNIRNSGLEGSTYIFQQGLNFYFLAFLLILGQ